MITSPTIARSWALLVLLAACDGPQGEAAVEELGIPLAVPSLPANLPTEEDRTFPGDEPLPRDPFITKAELEFTIKKPEPVLVVVDAAKPAPKPVVKRAPVPVLDRLDLELKSLFTGRTDGRKHAVARDRRTGSDLQIDEGEFFGEFEVTRIDDDGITLRQKGGASVRQIPFRKAAEDVIFFKSKPQ